MLFRRLLFFILFSTPLIIAQPGPATEIPSVLVIPFNNETQQADLNWIGESISETIMTELSADGLIVLDRDTRTEGYKRLGIKADAVYTKATLFKLGQTLDANLICYGGFQITLPAPNAQPRDGTIRISARFLDMRRLRDASEFSETGKLADLSRLEEHLAWQCLRFVNPATKVTAEQLLATQKLIRLDAKESYTRGLLALGAEQKQKWFEQAAKLDSRFAEPQFELGRLAIDRKDYKQATAWLGRIPHNNPLYLEARFRMGLSSYMTGDYRTAKDCFHELSQDTPLNEVFNNLGAAESRLNEPAALDDFKRAVDGDSTDPTYNFNYAIALYRQTRYDEAAQRLRQAIEKLPNDSDATAFLARCEHHAAPSGPRAWPAERLKENFDWNAFRQLKAVLQSAR